MLSNTYHLHLRPGEALVPRGGRPAPLHELGPSPILTDSGGFQVFSLAAHAQDPQKRAWPSRAIWTAAAASSRPEVSHATSSTTLGSDIAMAFDVCSPYPCDYDTAKDGHGAHASLGRALQKVSYPTRIRRCFGIVQGAFYKDLRIESAKALSDMDFPGYGIGGLSVGEPKPVMYEMLDELVPYLPDAAPALSDGRRHARLPAGRRIARRRYV